VREGAELDTVTGALVAQMASTPDVIALSAEDATLTYAELDEASARLAHGLDAADPDRRCAAAGVLVPMGAGAVVGMVGATRSGRTIVALDVAWPAARIAEICAQVGPSVVLTDRAHVDLLPPGTPYAAVDDLPHGLPPGPPELRAQPDDPFAITFTSGSTGRPKGAVRSQRSQTSAISRMRREQGYLPGLRVGLVHEYTFAACRVPVWGGLGNGITLVVRDVRRHGPSGLATWLAEERIQRISLPASLVDTMLDVEPPEGVLVDLEHVAFSGDVLRAATLDRLRPHLRPDAEIENAYGSSEMGGVSRHRFRADTPIDGPLVPAGTIQQHVEVRIVDPDDRGIGELEVHSAMVAMGYVDGGTDDRDSFPEDELGRRWFRSGDLGRVREDGLLEIHGRLDDR
jgi:non-ribosomal peptide synthetase component F